MYGFACPIGLDLCGKIERISKDFSEKNVFVAIPYSDYDFEETIRETLRNSGLKARLAKDRISTRQLLCKVCEEFRTCKYGLVDISYNNLNVVYELGLMQSLNIKCAILYKRGSERQTDLQGIENVPYDDSKSLDEELTRWVGQNITSSD